VFGDHGCDLPVVRAATWAKWLAILGAPIVKARTHHPNPFARQNVTIRAAAARKRTVLYRENVRLGWAGPQRLYWKTPPGMGGSSPLAA
jgi:hypothetical protein